MNEKELSQEVLHRIAEEGIEPKPHWEFLLRESVIWTLVALCVLVGGLAVSVILTLLVTDGLGLALVHAPSKGLVLVAMPYIWLVLLLIFLLVAEYNIRHTKRGYRYRWATVFVGVILLSILLGMLFFRIGWGESVERVSHQVPFYERVAEQREELWEHPERGLIRGEISELSVDLGVLRLNDSAGREWSVIFEKNALSRNHWVPSAGSLVKVLGRQTGELEFRARAVLPWNFDRAFPIPRPIIPAPAP